MKMGTSNTNPRRRVSCLDLVTRTATLLHRRQARKMASTIFTSFLAEDEVKAVQAVSSGTSRGPKVEATRKWRYDSPQRIRANGPTIQLSFDGMHYEELDFTKQQLAAGVFLGGGIRGTVQVLRHAFPGQRRSKQRRIWHLGQERQTTTRSGIIEESPAFK